MKNAILQPIKVIQKVLFFFPFLILTVNAHAAEVSGVWFNENYADQGINMSLQGTGIKTLLFFKAFAAGFYKGQGDQTDLLGNYPKRIEVEYFINIPGAKLNNFTIEKMRDNVSKTQFEALQEKIKQMGQYFVDLKPGDRFSLTYLPGVGTKFAHNGYLVGIIKGNDFAKALFSVWIGKRPFDDHLKKQVLGLKQTV